MSKQKKPIVLTPEEQKALEEGLHSEATGREYTLEESIEFARSRRKEWTNRPQDLSA